MSSVTELEFIPKYCAKMSLAIGAVLLPCCPFFTYTATAISGSSNGANPTNQAFALLPFPVDAEPVFPPTSMLKLANAVCAVPASLDCLEI